MQKNNNNWIQKKYLNINPIILKKNMILKKIVQNNYKELINRRKLFFPMIKLRIKKNISIVQK
jgi:hypothetical protein